MFGIVPISIVVRLKSGSKLKYFVLFTFDVSFDSVASKKWRRPKLKMYNLTLIVYTEVTVRKKEKDKIPVTIIQSSVVFVRAHIR